MTTGGRGMVVPGSVGRGAGINVISVAVPTGGDVPFVLDMATTIAAGSKFEIALRNDWATVPEGWAVDKTGKPLTDPKRFAAEGALLPLGGLQPETGTYKGFGLSVMVDIFCSILSGSVSISELLTRPDTALRASHFFGALKIDGFMPADDFARAMAGMVKVYHDLPKAPGVERITLAGEPEPIWAFLGSGRLAAPIGMHRPDLVVHGHAHHGSARGAIGEVPVYNVAVHVTGQDFVVLDL